MATEKTAGGGKSRRGFASMDAQKQRAIAGKGGQTAHQRGTAHEFTSDEARAAGHKGGVTISQDRDHMAEIGKKGGDSVKEKYGSTFYQSIGKKKTSG